MTRVRGVSGGGASGKFIAETKNPKTEPRVNNIDPRRPSMIGASTAFFKPPLYSSQASTPYGATPGNDCRPGGNGRVILKSGSQSATPNPTPMGGPRRSLFR
jgi:hypothetical protein